MVEQIVSHVVQRMTTRRAAGVDPLGHEACPQNHPQPGAIEDYRAAVKRNMP